MGWDGSTTLPWGGERRQFRLGMRELVAVEDDAGVGIVELYRQLGRQEARLPAVRAVLKYGLEGAGLSPNRALGIIERYFETGGPQAVVDHYVIALRILEAALTLPRELEESDAGKKQGDGAEEMAMTASPSPSSTPTPS